GLHGRGTGVERRRVDDDVGPQVTGERPVGQADQGGGVGQVREVAETQGDRPLRGGGGARAARLLRTAAATGGDEYDGRQGAANETQTSGHRVHSLPGWLR